MNRIELTRVPGIRQLLANRPLQTGLRAVTLLGFLLAIAAGLFGTRVGSHNFAIIFVWIAWWTGLKLFFIPLGGRSWCAICPIPMPGEWLQHGALLGPAGKGYGLGKRWPARLRSSWLQTGFFVLMGLFSAVILTQPRVTGWVLLGLIALAIGLSLVFERRAFCRYLCPIGGFTGLYAQAAPLEVRVKDPAICLTHAEKTCYKGSSEGYGCPWGLFPAALKQNTHCGLCMECLRTCSYDNIALNLRWPGAELTQPAPARLDEAVLGLVMLGSGLIYSAVFLGPWGPLKAAAYQIGTLPWLVYALGFLAIVLGVVPGLFFAAAGLGKKLSGLQTSLRKTAGQMSQALQPLGLSTWIAFTLAFAFAKLSYILPVLSDPFGWGWRLLGVGPASGTPALVGLTPYLQAAAIAAGLFYSARTARAAAGRLAGASGRAALLALPVILFCMAYSAGLLALLLA